MNASRSSHLCKTSTTFGPRHPEPHFAVLNMHYSPSKNHNGLPTRFTTALFLSTNHFKGHLTCVYIGVPIRSLNISASGINSVLFDIAIKSQRITSCSSAENQMLSLLSLPYEVLSTIVESISFNDYYNLGLSCRHLSFLLKEEQICKLVVQVSLT